jgi:DNA-directed RNA polymerase specialized sigma24 family protein
VSSPARGSEWKQLEEQYPLLRRKLVFFFRHRAMANPEECADETVRRTLTRLREVELTAPLESFCFGIARMVLLEGYKTRSTEELTEHAAPGTTSLGNLNSTETGLLVKQALDTLGEADRDVFVRYHLGGDRKALCAELGVSEGALRVRIARIKARLFEWVESRPKPKDAPGNSPGEK